MAPLSTLTSNFSRSNLGRSSPKIRTTSYLRCGNAFFFFFFFFFETRQTRAIVFLNDRAHGNDVNALLKKIDIASCLIVLLRILLLNIMFIASYIFASFFFPPPLKLSD